MTDTNLDRAAQMAGYDGWTDAENNAPAWSRGVIRTHAETLDELEAFKREVSEAVKAFFAASGFDATKGLSRFIIAKPDPLVGVVNELGLGSSKTAAADLRAALAKRGLKLERIEHE